MSDTFTIVVVIAAAVVVWIYLLAAKQKAAGTRNSASRRSTSGQSKNLPTHDEFHWPSIGAFDFEVVGESNYQGAISKLAGVHGTDGANLHCVASLIPENLNRHDPKAVAVKIQGEVIGYLSRDDARSFRRRLAQKKFSGATTTCDACIVGGGIRKSGERLFYGVRLDIKPFDS